MSKKIKMGLLAGFVLCFFGIFLFFLCYMAGGKSYVETADLDRLDGTATWEDRKPDLILEKTKLEDITSIEVELNDIHFFIEPSEDENYYISYQVKSRKKQTPIQYKIESKVLTIKENKKSFSFISIGIDIGGFFTGNLKKEKEEDYQEKVIIYVPKQEKLKDCQVTLHDSDIRIKEFCCENAKIELAYGNLFLENASFLESSMTLGDGKMEIENTDLHDTNIIISYGDLKIKNDTIENGNILLKDGTMDSSNVKFLKQNTIKSQYGDIKLGIEKEILNTMNLKLKTNYGKIEVPKDLSGSKESNEDNDTQSYEKTIENTENELQIIAEDGDIILAVEKHDRSV